MAGEQQEPTGPPGATLDVVRLGHFVAVLGEADDQDHFLDNVVRAVAALFDSDIVTIDTVSEGGTRSVSRASFGLSERSSDDAVDPEGLRLALGAGQPLVLDDNRKLPPNLAENGVKVGVGVPFSEASTVMSLYRRRPVPFAVEEIDLMVLMGRYLIAGLRRGQLARLAEHSVRVGLCRSEPEMLEVAVDGVLPLLAADAAGVALINDGVVRFGANRGLGSALRSWSAPVDKLAASSVLRDRRPRRFTDIRNGDPERSEWRIRAAIFAPVVVDDVVVALLAAYRYTTRSFYADDEYVLTMLAGQVAAAMANARLVQQSEQRRIVAESLRDLLASLNASMSVAEIGERCLTAMLKHSDASRGVLLLLDEDQRDLVPVCTEPENVDILHSFVGLFGAIAVGDSPLIALALSEQRAVMRAVGEGEPAGARCWLLAQPLMVHTRNVGLVLLEWHTETQPSPPWTVPAIAEMGAITLDHAQLFEHAERSGLQLAALHDVAVAINTDDDIATTLTRIVDSVRRLTGADVARIGVVDHGADTFTNVAVSGEGERSSLLGLSDSMSHTVGAWVVHHGQTAWVPNTAAGTSEPPEAAAWIHDKTPGSALAVPMYGRAGAALGFLTLRHPQPYRLARSCLPVVERFATEAGLAVENRRVFEARRSLETQLREQASRDPLTGLANRTRLLELIGRALTTAAQGRNKSTLAVLFLDLDRFKTVNDSLGHAAGDELLCAVGQRLSDAARPGEVVGHLGGDEFVFLVEGLPRRSATAGAELAAERMLLSLGEPFVIRQRPVVMSASVGLTVASGADRDAEDLLRDADVAVYRAKAAGKAQVLAFEPSMSVTGLLDMESDLRHALDEQLLQVHYQPIVELSTGKAVGLEALARWDHPTLGWVPPDEFVALAEETGLVRRLDQWVLQTALRDVAMLHEQRPELTLSVNLSAMHLHERALAARIAHTVQASGVRPELLTMEITETAAMWDPRRTLDSLTALQSAGIGVVLDDFGTGYSNFGYLKKFPLRGLKIDRVFVEQIDVDPQDAAIVAALITLSESLGIGVIAEGVETRGQQLRLLELGCRRAQGYLFSPAMAFAELATYFRTHP